ncbi:hypothetical protein Fot_24296 [Forsythia ovata]|uniref:Uncharacterized protein n=1 Tax=Forsythia ovata TaxID=205694 RepID=A0ABD1U6H5_9LAMI
MSGKDESTHIRQPEERLVGAAEGAPEVPQPPRRGRCSMARMAHNLELMAKQMLEMQRQHVAQTVVLNAYLQQGFMPPAPPVYPSYYPQGYEDQHENEEDEDPYSYASLVQLRAPFRANKGVDPFQYPYQGYNVEENYGNPGLSLDTHKNRIHPRDPVSSTDWEEYLIEIGGREG